MRPALDDLPAVDDEDLVRRPDRGQPVGDNQRRPPGQRGRQCPLDRRLGISYSKGPSLGDPASPVQQSCSVVGRAPVPDRPMPEVVARIGIDLDPVDVTDTDDARWLRACVWPDQRGPAAAAAAVDVLPDAFARVPAGAMPVVITTWALSHFRLESRLRFLHRLDEAAAGRPVAWVSAEGVGVAPRYRPWATAVPRATASSAWRCSTGRPCAPRPSAAAGRRAACWRGWPAPSRPAGAH
jgi:Uncharacterized protein conserved in bacteria (DUF2332)